MQQAVDYSNECAIMEVQETAVGYTVVSIRLSFLFEPYIFIEFPKSRPQVFL